MDNSPEAKGEEHLLILYLQEGGCFRLIKQRIET